MVIKKANKKYIVETVADLIKPSKKYLYKCNCVYCNGKKVDSRTQEKHTKSKSLWKCEISRKNQENSIKAKRKKKSITSNVNPTKPNLPKKRKMISPSTPPNPPDSPNNEDSINTLFSSKPKSSSRFHDPASDLIEDENNVNNYYYPDYSNDNNNSDDNDNNPDDDNYHLDEEDDNFDEEDENEDDTNKEDGKVAIMKCLHQEFPNNPIPSHRKLCNNPLSVFKKNKGEVIAVPQMLYPKPSV